MKIIFFSLMIFLATASAHAALSLGVQSCGVFVEDYDKEGWERTANVAWLAGFISGYNAATNSDIGRGVNIRSIDLHVYNFCKKNPLKDTYDAVADVIKNLE